MKELATWGPMNAVKAMPVTASVGKPYSVMYKIIIQLSCFIYL